jgi:hypothetical protein
MNAVATLSSEQAVAPNSWLVPTNAIRTQGGASTVTVLRNAQPLAITVTTGAIQGEWTTVASAELQAGDQVVGSLSSSDDSSDAFGPPGGMGGAMPLGGGAPPNGGN